MRVLEILADATNVIAEGEVLQLMNMQATRTLDEQRLPARDPAQDREAVRGGRSARRRAGRCAARASRTALARYGMHLGTAFQLIDDVLDYSGDLRRDRQESRRRPRRRQDDAAADPRDVAWARRTKRDLIRHAISTAADRPISRRSWQRSGALARSTYARERAQRGEQRRGRHVCSGLPASPAATVCYNYRLLRRSARTDCAERREDRRSRHRCRHSGCSLAW